MTATQDIDNWRVVAAVLLYEQLHDGSRHGVAKQIAVRMGADPAAVSRWLDAGRDAGLLNERVIVDKSKATPSALQKAKNEILKHDEGTKVDSNKLKQRLRDWGVEDVFVSPTHDHLDYGPRLDRFAADIASDLKTKLSHCSQVGVAWGETVARCIRAVTNSKRPRTALRNKASIDFVPLCGEQPLYTPYSATRLAGELHEYFNVRASKQPLSLAGVPAYLPHGQSRTDREALMKAVRSAVPDFAEVFGKGRGQTRRADRCDLVLASAGVLGQHVLDHLIRDLPSDKLKSDFRSLIIGDCCGALISRRELAGDYKKLVDDCQAQWTGANLHELTSGWGEPRVLLVAINENKGEICDALIRRMQWIKYLFCDQSLARRLLERLKSH